MKNPSRLIKLCLVLGIITVLTTIGDYLALQDIRHDYVSREVIDAYGGHLTLNLPDWSETKSEWKMINFSGIMRAVYLLFSLATLLVLFRIHRKKAD